MLQEIDQIVEAEIKPGGPGAAVAVVKDGEVIHRKGYGLANIEWNIPITPDTVFRLASISKQFTAVAIMMLAERGKLSVDDLLTDFLPDYPTSGHDITIHHLLTHTSGIASYTSIPEFLQRDGYIDRTTTEMVDYFKSRPFDFRPGARYLYNNSGYFLLGVIIEKVSGQSYEDFLRENIFAPLGMAQSYYMHTAPIIPKRASGYHPSPDGGFINAPYLSMTAPYAAGSLGSTVDDLVKWDQALRRNTLIKAETLKRMHQPTTLNDGSTSDYGYGWVCGQYHEHAIVHHSGGIHGFSTNMIHYFDDGLGVIVLSNFAGFETGKVMMAISRRILGLPDAIRTPITLDEAALQKAAGAYLLSTAQAIPVTVENGKLIISLGLPMAFLPTSSASFYRESDPEMVLIFEDEADGAFQTMKLESPLMKLALKRAPQPAEAQQA